MVTAGMACIVFGFGFGLVVVLFGDANKIFCLYENQIIEAF